MAQAHETGDPIVTANNPIIDLLSAPLDPDWTVEKLAEQLLDAIAAQSSGETQEIVLHADAVTDRQLRRLLRPLLACLATKSAAEAGMSADLYGGSFSFKRPGPEGPVWILGQFENRPGSVRVTLRRFSSPPPPTQCRYCKGSGIDPKSHHRFTTGGHDDRRCPRCDGQGAID
jgi:hypothetical protein